MINFEEIDNSIRYCIRKLFDKNADNSFDGKRAVEDNIIRKYADEKRVERELEIFNSKNENKAYLRFADAIRARKRERRRLHLLRFVSFSIPAAAILIIALILFGNDNSDVTIINKAGVDNKGYVLLVSDDGKYYSTKGEIKVVNNDVKAKDKIPVEINKVEDQEKLNDQINTVITSRGIRQKITLSDGTVVWINSGSRLSFPTEFNDSIRKVTLTGEAFFDVSKSVKPFIVSLCSGDVRVLGTTFNVASYENSSSSDIWLYAGSVKVETPKMSVMLNPGFNVQIDNLTSDISGPTGNINKSPDWMRGRLEFYSQPLYKVFEVIQRWYGVEYEISEDARNLEVTVIICDTISFEELTGLLVLAQKIEIIKDENKIYISKIIN